MNIVKKCLIIVLITITIIAMFPTINTYADFDDVGEGGSGAKDVVLNPDKYKPGSIKDSEVGELLAKGNIIVGVIQVVGSIISVVALVIIGIKYMTGSLEEKAEYKKTMIPYIIGATMLFAASNLVQAIYEWSQAINNI